MTNMDLLIRRGVTVTDAAKILFEYNKRLGLSPPNPEKIRQMYYDWKLQLEKITEYPLFDLPEILQNIPREIAKKYSFLFEK